MTRMSLGADFPLAGSDVTGSAGKQRATRRAGFAGLKWMGSSLTLQACVDASQSPEPRIAQPRKTFARVGLT